MPCALTQWPLGPLGPKFVSFSSWCQSLGQVVAEGGTLLMRQYLWVSVGGELEVSKSENHRRIQSTEQKTHFLWDPLKCGPLGHVPLANCCMFPWHGPIQKSLFCTKILICHFELFTENIGKFSTLFFLRPSFFDQNTTNGPLTHKFVHLPHLQACTEFYNLMTVGEVPIPVVLESRVWALFKYPDESKVKSFLIWIHK